MTMDLDRARKILAESDVLVSAAQCSAATTRMAGEITAASETKRRWCWP